jgi:hypothetical protein
VLLTQRCQDVAASGELFLLTSVGMLSIVLPPAP